MEQFWITVLSIGAGAVGYLMVTFWVRPILRFGDIKNQIASNLILYANTLDVNDSSGNLDKRALERKAKNREDAAQLEAICRNLPWWYKMVKKKLSRKSFLKTLNWQYALSFSYLIHRTRAPQYPLKTTCEHT